MCLLCGDIDSNEDDLLDGKFVGFVKLWILYGMSF